MNKSYFKYISLAVFLSAIAACSEFGAIDSASDDGNWDVTASLSMSVDSKITEDGNSLFWQEGDKVAFKAVAGNVESEQAVLTLNRIDSGLPEAKFKGNVTMTKEPENCFFAYPSDALIAKDGSVTFDFSAQDGTKHSPYLYGSAAYSEDGIDAVLKHAAAMIRLTVPEGVTKVEVSANSLSDNVVNDLATQKISKVMVSQNGDVSVLEDALDKITVTVASAAKNYVFVPAMNFIDGFSFIMTTESGEMMVKSYSIDGGQYSDYQFEAGSVLDIDLSGGNKPEGISISCDLSDAVHQIENGLLTGTNINVESFTVSGVPAKIVDQIGVAVYEGEYGKPGSVLVRFWNRPGAFSESAPLGVQNNWPLLLPDKTYNAYAICQINGKYHTSHIGEVEVPALPELSLSLSAETSYTVYKSQGATAANALDGNTLYNVTATTNIHKDLLNNEKYELELIVNTDAHSVTLSPTSGASSNTYDLGNWSGHSPKNYSLSGSLVFAGKSKTASVYNLHVTGLPYHAKMTSTEWNITGNASFESDHIQLGGGTGNAEATSKYQFHIPASINVLVNTNVTVKALYWVLSTQNTDFTVSVGGNTIIKQNSNNERNGKNYDLSASCSISSAPSIMLKSSYEAAGPLANVYSFNMIYN